MPTAGQAGPGAGETACPPLLNTKENIKLILTLQVLESHHCSTFWLVWACGWKRSLQDGSSVSVSRYIYFFVLNPKSAINVHLEFFLLRYEKEGETQNKEPVQTLIFSFFGKRLAILTWLPLEIKRVTKTTNINLNDYCLPSQSTNLKHS